MNAIHIKGRLARDPELKVCNSGREVCNFCVAVDRFAKNGEEKQCDFIDCTAWGKTGVLVSQYFVKGKEILLSGSMESRKWQDKDGNSRVSWSVNCHNVEFCGGKSDGGNHVEGAVPVSEIKEIPNDEELPF